MKKVVFVNVTSHTLTEAQKSDAIASFGITEFVELPSDLKAIWGNIPPEASEVEIEDLLTPIVEMLYGLGRDVFVLCQGEQYASMYISACCYLRNLPTVIATTRRESVEENGKKVSVFKHVKFRVTKNIFYPVYSQGWDYGVAQ